MVSDETVTELQKLALPWSREVVVQEVAYESGMKMLRLRFKEGRARFTIIDLDVERAAGIGKLLGDWAAAQGG